MQTSHDILDAENQPHSMILPPLLFTVGMVLARWLAVPASLIKLWV